VTSAYAWGVNMVNVIDPAVVFCPDPLHDGDAAGASLVEVRRSISTTKDEMGIPLAPSAHPPYYDEAKQMQDPTLNLG
jgi:hypothetical protein